MRANTDYNRCWRRGGLHWSEDVYVGSCLYGRELESLAGWLDGILPSWEDG